MSVEIKVKRLHEDAKLPTKAHPNDAGYDVYACEDPIFRKDPQELKNGGYVITYKTGIAVEIPKGYMLDFRSRSSICKNATLILSNGVGTIDADYRGEILAVFRPTAKEFQSIYKKGDKIGQLILIKLPDSEIVEVEELSETKRGKGGYGSSDQEQELEAQE